MMNGINGMLMFCNRLCKELVFLFAGSACDLVLTSDALRTVQVCCKAD